MNVVGLLKYLIVHDKMKWGAQRTHSVVHDAATSD